MKENKKSLFYIWKTLGIFTFLYFTIAIATKEQGFLWLLLTAYSLWVSVFLLKNHKMQKGKALIMPVVFTFLYLLSCIYSFNLFSVIHGITVFLSSCAVIATLTDVTGSFYWVKKGKKYDFLLSIFLGILIGVAWGIINYLLMRGSNEKIPTEFMKAGIVALNPAVAEEIANRTVFYAFCVHAMKGLPTSRKENLTCWFMMMVPHILPHILFSLEGGFVNALVSFVISLVLYILVFGFVFAFLQRKRDVLSAMVAHGLVDAIRFSIFGLPY